MISIVVTALFEWLKRPDLTLEIENPPFDQQYASGHQVAQKARFLRVYVKNHEPRLFLRWLSRNAAFRCEAEIAFHDFSGRQLGKKMPGRWTGYPEPLQLVGRVGDQALELINPYYLAQEYRRIDIYSGAPQLLDIAARFDDDPECYGWTTENYNWPRWRNPEWRLSPKRYLVNITVRADAAATSETFLLINDTAAAGGFRLEPKRILNKASPHWLKPSLWEALVAAFTGALVVVAIQ